MCAHGLEGDLHLPATQGPSHHRVRGALRVGAEQDRRCADPGRVAQQYPAQGHDRLAGVVPEGRARGIGIVQDLTEPVVPAHGQRSPSRLRVCQPLPQRGQTRTLEPRAARLARCPGWRRRIQGRVQAQAQAHDGHEGPSLTGRQQAQGGIGPVGHHDQVPVGQPAAQETQHLARPVGKRLVAPALFPMVAGRRGQDREEGQGPDPLRPRDPDEPHQAEPA